MLRNVLIVCLYLVLHFMIQTMYQYDLMCPHKCPAENSSSPIGNQNDLMCPHKCQTENSTGPIGNQHDLMCIQKCLAENSPDPTGKPSK